VPILGRAPETGDGNGYGYGNGYGAPYPYPYPYPFDVPVPGERRTLRGRLQSATTSLPPHLEPPTSQAYPTPSLPLSPLRRSIGTKLILAVGLPSTATGLALATWLSHATPAARPGVIALAALVAVTAVVHAVAVRLVLGRPLARLAAAVRRARDGDFLLRVPVETGDDIGRLAGDINTTLAAITDLHALRIQDAASMESMQRELALKAQLEARVRELTLLSDLARRLSATLDLDRLVTVVTELVGRGLGDHACALLLADAATGELVVRGVSGLDEAVTGTRIAPGSGPAGWAARERATVLVGDTDRDPRRPVLPWQGGAHGTVLAVPLLHQDACAGVLAFFRPARDAFPPDEVRLLESVAGQAATALENASLHQAMVRLSQTDALTGVHNRRSLFARLEMERERCERFDHPVALALVDVDEFRRLNEAAGHAAGDEILRRVARTLSATVRKVDLVARYGGEEFAVVLPGADGAAALAAGEKLRAAVAAEGLPHANGVRGRITISVGVAAWPADGRDVEALIDAADAALYAAKRAGRDAVRGHEPGMRTHPGRKRDARTTAAADAATSPRP
jgi:diguanylate cyclase (GGDEF)-like protein